MISNQTWTDELTIKQIQRLDWWNPCYCDHEWDCKNEISHAVAYKMAFDIERIVFLCSEHWGEEE